LDWVMESERNALRSELRKSKTGLWRKNQVLLIERNGRKIENSPGRFQFTLALFLSR
jgi:hypothetical protein